MRLLWAIEGDGLVALRDRAILAFGMAFAARRSELVALMWTTSNGSRAV